MTGVWRTQSTRWPAAEALLSSSPNDEPVKYTRNQELRSFLFLTVVMAPAFTGMIIAGYRFLV